MRVIAGKAKSLRLQTIEGMDTRPTTDRIKETLFNMLQPYLADCRFLDLFAGSGAIGIEALSRGADFCVFIEQNKKAVDCIRQNLQHTHLQEQGKLFVSDVVYGLLQLKGKEPFDVIFMDPPYKKGLERETLQTLLDAQLIHKDTLIIVEASIDTTWEELSIPSLELVRCKKYKTNQHLFLQRRETV